VNETASLSIGDLAQRTGLLPGTLRSWETRYGFPRPVRLPGGHRRYLERDVNAVQEVVRLRDGGLALEAAVRRVATGDSPTQQSVYAGLRQLYPELAPQVITRHSMLALSRALEDECCARASRPVLFAAFQTQRRFDVSRERWRELARTARSTVVLAQFTQAEPPDGLVQVTLPDDSAAVREWLVVCDAVDLPACLVGWERQRERPGNVRRFEAVWSVDPQIVRDATRLCASICDDHLPGWRTGEWPELEEIPPPASTDLRRANGLLTRMVGYLDEHHVI
jgi:DNA-binding transcriptional MerR regulator